MREILFRGKRLNNGEWVEGNLFIPDKVARVDVPTEILMGTNVIRISYAVDPETVGQYTELKDKNGKRIFEGDIVVYDNTPYNAYGHRVTGVIVWHKWAWRFRYKEYESTYHYAIGAEDFFGAKSEVIGNIHDNPELLED